MAPTQANFNLPQGVNVPVFDTEVVPSTSTGVSPQFYGPIGFAKGTATMAGASVTITLPFAYSSTVTYFAFAVDMTAANAVQITRNSATSFKITGTGTDIVEWFTAGY